MKKHIVMKSFRKICGEKTDFNHSNTFIETHYFSFVNEDARVK